MSASPLQGERLKLSFEEVTPNPAHEALSPEEARAVLAVFHEALLGERPQIRILVPPGAQGFEDDRAEEWERRMLAGFELRFGRTLLPVPGKLEQSQLFHALRLSLRYMGPGVRDAAQEMFASPIFVASVCLSIAMYFGAWLAPEPLFTKAFAATVTVALALAVGVIELSNLARACVRLYQDVAAARTEVQLEVAAERFGKSVGGTGLRVLVLVASFGLGKAVPPVPPGGLWSLLGSPRYAVEGGVVLGTAATAQLVAHGSLIVSGVAAGELAERLCGGLAVCATTENLSGVGGSKLSTRYGPPHTRENPAHNEAIERDLAAREAAEHTSLRKNKAQRNAQDKRAYDEEAVDGPRFRRPDVSSLRPDGVRHNTNYVSHPRDMKRELEAFEAMVQADRKAIHELFLLDGTLVRRFVPTGVRYP